VNRNTNPNDHRHVALYDSCDPCRVAHHLKILILVRTATIIVADVKYARVSTSIRTVNMWFANTTNFNPIAIIVKIICKLLNDSFFPLSWQMMREIIPNPGKIKMYTSGCPKNQNRCWYRIWSPPPAGSKNDVPYLLE
jgi:hypothetical protein